MYAIRSYYGHRDADGAQVGLGAGRVVVVERIGKRVGTDKAGPTGTTTEGSWQAGVNGAEPGILMLAGSAMVENADEYDVVGTLRGEPVEVVKAPLTGLPIPATAEVVLEGYIDGDDLREEGPFGEYTGYYTDELVHPIKSYNFV